MAFAALKRLGQSLLGNDTLRKVQQHLERDEGALAWREACSESWSSAEGLATSAVAAGCCGHWDEAAEILQRVESLPAVSVEENLACQALLHRVCALREQQQTGQGLLCGPLWCPEPPALELPASWSSWARALPQVAEYVGPVEVRWTEGSERGLFTSRAVEAGEVLMVAQPIAFAAQNGPLLVAELRRKCAVSQRARRRLECLADRGARGSTMSPEEVTQELFIRADEPPGEPTVEASPEGDLRLQDILNHNVFVVDHSGEAALYGLPSMLNHSCDVTALKLVLVFFEKAMIFIATRDLEKGEELCHRYFDVEGSVRERRGESSKWGFSCDCCRCHFEANTLPFSDCGKAVEAAVTLFQEELRYDMRALSQAAEVKAEVEQKRWPLLQRLLSAVVGGFVLCEGLPFPRSMSDPPLREMGPKGAVEDCEVVPVFEDMEDSFLEAMDRIILPFPWERRVVQNRPGHFYFLDPRSERTTWKDPRFLAKGWEQRIDPRGQVYFQYHFTRQTTTIDPRGCPVGWDMRLSDDGEIYFAFRPAMRTTRRDPRGLPEHVDPALDQRGRMYFKVHDTQSTTWEDPRAGQPEVTLKLWRQAQRTRWWKEKVRKEVEEMTRLKELKEMSKVDMEILVLDKEPSESSV